MWVRGVVPGEAWIASAVSTPPGSGLLISGVGNELAFLCLRDTEEAFSIAESGLVLDCIPVLYLAVLIVGIKNLFHRIIEF